MTCMLKPGTIFTMQNTPGFRPATFACLFQNKQSLKILFYFIVYCSNYIFAVELLPPKPKSTPIDLVMSLCDNNTLMIINILKTWTWLRNIFSLIKCLFLFFYINVVVFCMFEAYSFYLNGSYNWLLDANTNIKTEAVKNWTKNLTIGLLTEPQ